MANGTLDPWPGIRPMPPALETQSQTLDRQGSPLVCARESELPDSCAQLLKALGDVFWLHPWPTCVCQCGLTPKQSKLLGVDWLISKVARSHGSIVFIKHASSVLTQGEVCGCNTDFFPLVVMSVTFLPLHCSPFPSVSILHILPWKKWKCESLSHVQLFATPWTVAHQVPLSMEFSRQEYFPT